MRKYLKFIIPAVLALVAILLVPVVAIGSAFVGNAPLPETGPVTEGVELVKDGYVSAYILDTSPGHVALVDCGQAGSGGAVESALKARNLGPEAVEAVFLTHGHRDHAGGCGIYTNAKIYAMEREIPILEGKEGTQGPIPRLVGPDDTGVRGTVGLKDLQSITVGSTTVVAFALPGHTAGSAVFYANGCLFFGDSAGATSSGAFSPAVWIFSDDTAQNRSGLRDLNIKVGPIGARYLLFSHTGPLEGMSAFDAWSRS